VGGRGEKRRAAIAGSARPPSATRHADVRSCVWWDAIVCPAPRLKRGHDRAERQRSPCTAGNDRHSASYVQSVRTYAGGIAASFRQPAAHPAVCEVIGTHTVHVPGVRAASRRRVADVKVCVGRRVLPPSSKPDSGCRTAPSERWGDVEGGDQCSSRGRKSAAGDSGRRAARLAQVWGAYLRRTAIWIRRRHHRAHDPTARDPPHLRSRTGRCSGLIRQQQFKIEASGHTGLFTSDSSPRAFYPEDSRSSVRGSYSVGAYLSISCSGKGQSSSTSASTASVRLAFGGMTWLAKQLGPTRLARARPADYRDRSVASPIRRRGDFGESSRCATSRS